MRRLFAAVVLVALTGVLPVAASVAACAKHSCCAKRTNTVDTERNCCTVAASPSSAPTPAEQVSPVAALIVPAANVVVVAAPQDARHPRDCASASPPTSRRLAALSTLLI